MFVVDNKFNVGEECYTVYRKPKLCEVSSCPVYRKFYPDCYNVCKLYKDQKSFLGVCKVKVRKIKASIDKEDKVVISYKVLVDDEYYHTVKAKNRGARQLFKTYEEAQQYCNDVNDGKIKPEF